MTLILCWMPNNIICCHSLAFGSLVLAFLNKVRCKSCLYVLCFLLRPVHMTSRGGISSPATTDYSIQVCKMGICLSRYHSGAFSDFISSIPQMLNCCFQPLVITHQLCMFSCLQIVIHAMQCTHYIILWHLAKLSEGSSSKVFIFWHWPIMKCFKR